MSELEEGKKYCKHCGEIIDKDCVVCPKCGKQVEALKDNSTPVIINNSAASSSSFIRFYSNMLYRRFMDYLDDNKT